MNTYKFLLNDKVVNTRKNNREYNFAQIISYKFKDDYFTNLINEKIELYKNIFESKNFELLRLENNGGYKVKEEFKNAFGELTKELIGVKHPMRNFSQSYEDFISQFTFDNFVQETETSMIFKNFYIGVDQTDFDWASADGNIFSDNYKTKEEIESIIPERKIKFGTKFQYLKTKPKIYLDISFSKYNSFDNSRHWNIDNSKNPDYYSKNMDFYVKKIVPVENGIAKYSNPHLEDYNV